MLLKLELSPVGPAGYHTRVGSPPLPCGAFFFTFRHAGIAHAGALRCPRGNSRNVEDVQEAVGPYCSFHVSLPSESKRS